MMYLKEQIDHYLDHHSHPKAGIILLTSESDVLILKGKPGKWTFPKGGQELICQHCHDVLTDPLDYIATCPQHPSQGSHQMIPETIRQCAERELFEETGLSLFPGKFRVISYHRVAGIKRDPGCVYLIVKCNQKKSELEAQIRIDEQEIVDYQWIKVEQLAQQAQKKYYHYNMGIRKMLSYLVTIDTLLNRELPLIKSCHPLSYGPSYSSFHLPSFSLPFSCQMLSKAT